MKLLIILFLSAQSLDCITSFKVNGRELNPLLPQNRYAICAVKLSVAVPSSITSWRFTNSGKKSKLLTTLLIIGTASGIYGTIHNSHKK